jgi:hypothetical protein
LSRYAVRFFLPILLLALTSCGGSKPTTQQWLEMAASHYQADYATDFEMSFELLENNQTVKVEHKGRLECRDDRHYRLQALTLMEVEGLSNVGMRVENLQVADGQSLWMQSTMGGVPQPVVLKRHLDELESMAQVNDEGANQLSPSDLNPLFLWRMALEHGEFTAAAESADGLQTLTSPATPKFLKAAAHRAEFWQPSQLEIDLHRATGAPVQLRLVQANGETSWQVQFVMWASRPMDDQQLHFTPPDDVQVLTQ